MNEIINPQCNSLIATFFESTCEVCPKTVSSSLRPKRTVSQLLELLFPFPLLLSPKIKFPLRSPERPTEVGGVCETDAGTEADVEDEDEDVDVVGGVDEVWVSGCESEGFTLSEIHRRKRLGKKVSEGVVDTAHLPQCEFPNLHRLPLALLLDFPCWPVTEFYCASNAARAGT